MNSPIWILPKKPDSQGRPRWRMVIDFRELNKKTIGDAYPLPNIADILDQLGGCKYFSTFDLANGFFQIPLKKEERWKTAFSTKNGHYQFRRMPMGLKNATSTFQRMMENVLRGLLNVEMMVYLDDIIIYAKNLTEHYNKTRMLFERLREARLLLQPDKVEFLKKEVVFLGHLISEKGLEPNPKKVSAVKNFPVPRCVRNIREFLGLTSYYRRFIEGFSVIAKPLHDLIKKGVPFNWGPAQQKAFQTLRDRLCEEPILKFPDFEKHFTVTTDASDHSVGAVLSQNHNDFDHPVAYMSRTLNKAQKNYSTTEKECLAALHAFHHFRPYLLGKKFTLIADHEPLSYMHSRKDPGQRLMRWMFKFSEYEYDFKYKPGKLNTNADALSRNPEREEQEEKEINKNLFLLKILVLKRKEEKRRQSEIPQGTQKSAQAKKTENQAERLRPTVASNQRAKINSVPEPLTRKASSNRGRPVGAKTNKNPVKLDHSTVAQRTRSRAIKKPQVTKNPSYHEESSNEQNASRLQISNQSQPSTSSNTNKPSIKIPPSKSIEQIEPSNDMQNTTRECNKEKSYRQRDDMYESYYWDEIPQLKTPTMSSTRIIDDETEEENERPLVDRRWSALRDENTAISESSDQEQQDKNDETMSDTEVTVSPVPTSESEDEEVFKRDENLSISRQELMRASQKLEESLRIHQEKTGEDCGINAEELVPVEFPTHFSDTDKPNETQRSILDEIDTYDPLHRDDSAMEYRIEEIVKKAEEKTRRIIEESDKEMLEIIENTENSNQHELNVSEMVERGSANKRAISVTPSIKMKTPAASSTPFPQLSKTVKFKDLDDIIEVSTEQKSSEDKIDDSAVKSNMSLESVLWPIFAPKEPFESPLNQYVDPRLQGQITSSSNEEAEINNNSGKRPLTLKNNVISSRQCLTYQRDNIVHFLSKDCELISSTTKLLMGIGAIDLREIKEKKPKVGQIMVTPFKNHFIFSLIVKDKYYDKLNISTVRMTLKSLKSILIKKNLLSFRVARAGNLTDSLEPGVLTEILLDTFSNMPIKVIICYGKTSLPTESERGQIIKALHDSFAGGHKGANQTYKKIRERYYWPGMRNDILDYLRNCHICKEKKIDRIKTREPMIITDTPIEAFDKVSIDTVGKLRTTPSGNCHLLTMQCNLTKYVIVIPIPNLRATTIADALAKYLICQFGAPRAILSDRGTSFLSEVVQALLKTFKINHLTTSGYRPQTNGSLERSHAPLVDFIRTYSETYDDWDQLAPFAAFTYNTSVHAATNFTPFELIYGRIARFPLRIPTDEKLRTYNIYLRDLIMRLDEMKMIAGENQKQNKLKAKERYDRHLNLFKGKRGDYAWVLNEHRKAKFDNYYNKPLKIVEVTDNKNAILELPNGKLIRKHTDKLKLVPSKEIFLNA